MPGVGRVLDKAVAVFRLARVTTAFAAVANVWFVILWARAFATEPAPDPLRTGPLWLMLLGGAIFAVGLYAFAACLNDVLDASRDRALNLDRPFSLGQLSAETAAVATAGTLIAAVVGATVFGTPGVTAALLLAGAILFFHAMGKHVPAVGLVVLAAIYAGHMLVPNWRAQFLLPVWLVMTHAVVVAGLRHVLGGRGPALTPRAALAAALGWLAVTASLAALAWYRGRGILSGGTGFGLWPDWLPLGVLVLPAVLAGAFALWVARLVRTVGPGQRLADKVGRHGALWLGLYAIAWLAGAGLLRPAIIMSVLTLTGFVGMTTLRNLYALVEHPLAYRR
jgi:hypothetical protein